MCQGKIKCEKQENLKKEKMDCSATQIKKCHGDVKTHPCVKVAKGRSRKD